jgi:hypothetical protein
MTLYCASDTKSCSRSEYFQKETAKNFTVKASNIVKTFPIGEGYVTYDIASDQNANIIELADGTLEVYYNSSTLDGNFGIYKTTSVDGVTWSKPKFFSDSWSMIDAVANKNSAFVFQNIDRGVGVVTTKGKEYKVKSTDYNYSVGSIIQAQDGYYYLTYNSYDPSHVYVIKTKDFKKWSTPKKISSVPNTTFGSSLIQTADGTFYLTYSDLGTNSLEILSSRDGENWNFEYRIGNQLYTNKTSLIAINNVPTILWSGNYVTYYSQKTLYGWSQPQVLLYGTPFGVDSLVQKDGSLVVVYVVEHNNQRDIKIKNLGKIGI